MSTISNHMFLTEDELHALTDYKRSAEQIRWLQERGYAHDIGASGKPKVLRAEVERHLMGGKGRAFNRQTPPPKLHTSAIRKEMAA